MIQYGQYIRINKGISVVGRTSPAKARKHTHAKHIKLHAHHSKPYRKRYISLFVAYTLGAIFLISLLITYRDQLLTGMASSRSFVSGQTTVNPDTHATYRSTYGFSLNVDQNKFYSMATSATDGATVTPEDATQQLPLRSIFLTSSQTAITQSTGFQLRYYPDLAGTTPTAKLREQTFAQSGINMANLTLITTKTVKIGNKSFQQTVWQTKREIGQISGLYASFSVYTGIVKDHPISILISEGVGATPGQHKLYDEVLQSLNFSDPTANVTFVPSTVISGKKDLTFLDFLLQAKVATAATALPKVSDTEKIAALYGPAVVKVYNAYCADVKMDSKLIAQNLCSAGSGSGFFVSKDGYIATNGHVASFNARDLAIYYSIFSSVFGASDAIDLLVNEAKVRQSDLKDAKTTTEAYGMLANKLYSALPESRFSLSNYVQNLFIATGTKQPDSENLVSDTKSRKKITAKDGFKEATLKATDFRMFDGYAGFKASDIAIIKVSGDNYPVVRLGSIDNATQGGNLAILGFPGNANDNGIVDSKTSTATLTTGKVSSLKNASGSTKKLIETDTTIGHGNSGGPAFLDSGEVIGIATYTADGAGQGDGVFNYIRDIKDLKSLAAKEGIAFDTSSETQSQWDEGMDNFYSAHYSKAVKNFDKVKELYPSHNKVAEFISAAQKRIANGEDVQDFPVIPVAIGAIVLLIGAVTSIIFVVRHKKKHNIYQAGIAQGAITPMSPGTPPQAVAVTPPSVQPVVPTAPAPNPSQDTAPRPQTPSQPNQPLTPQQPAQQPPVPTGSAAVQVSDQPSSNSPTSF